MTPELYFSTPQTTAQKHYDMFKDIYCNGSTMNEVCTKFGYTKAYVKKCKYQFSKDIATGVDPFFQSVKTGPKSRRTSQDIVEQIIDLRKKNYAITDIKSILDAQGKSRSYDTIDKILKSEGFSPLPKRTKREKKETSLPSTISAPKSTALKVQDESFSTEVGGGLLTFLPLIKKLGVVDAIKSANFPSTSQLTDVQSVMSFLGLKLVGAKRLSHDVMWNLDRALGLFAGLNVLPKASTLSTYSYRVSRESNIALLKKMSHIFESSGEFNLDFKTIPHWGDDSVLEKNWAGSKGKAIKSLLALIAQDPKSGMISYTDTGIKHSNESDSIIEFVDFWKDGKGEKPKMLIFDSKLTTYQNLNKLNEDDIKFLTLRKRGKKLIAQVEDLEDKEFSSIMLPRAKNRKQKVKILDRETNLTGYNGKVREIVIKDHGRQKPTFLITNDIESDAKSLLVKYAKRWLVEKEIAEQVAFFHLNSPSSSIVVKVDFDLTISVLAHNLYNKFAQELVGFENCQAQTLHRKFIDVGATIDIKDCKINVKLKKKTHLPILFEVPWLKQKYHDPDLKCEMSFSQNSTS